MTRELFTELSISVFILVFLAMVVGGSKHLHSGQCRDHHDTFFSTAHASEPVSAPKVAAPH